MNFHLDIEVEQFQLSGALRAILHTILFNRTFGVVRPTDVEMEFVDVVHPKCVDDKMDQAVNEKVNEFSKMMDSTQTQKGVILLQYMKAKAGWFASEEYWEQWTITVKITPAAINEYDRAAKTRKLGRDLNQVLLKIAQTSLQNVAHLPNFASEESGHPFKITIQSNAGTFDRFFRMLPAPPGAS